MFREQSSYVDIDDSLVRYASELCIKRPPHGAAVRRMETTGAQFDPSGRFLVADVSLFHPVLYAVGSPEPLATMSSLERYPHMNPCLSHPPHSTLDKYAGYRNSCTVKRGSFGFESQTGHLYYVTGSDDFRAYGWRIPPTETLLAQREAMPATDWLAHSTKGTDQVWFRTDASRDVPTMVKPLDLYAPSFTLEGSRSIVNSALCHPVRPYSNTDPSYGCHGRHRARGAPALFDACVDRAYARRLPCESPKHPLPHARYEYGRCCACDTEKSRAARLGFRFRLCRGDRPCRGASRSAL